MEKMVGGESIESGIIWDEHTECIYINLPPLSSMPSEYSPWCEEQTVEVSAVSMQTSGASGSNQLFPL